MQNSKILKVLVYSTVPILVMLIAINIFSVTYYNRYKEEVSLYCETEKFADDYLTRIEMVAQTIKDHENNIKLQSELICIKDEVIKDASSDAEIEYSHLYTGMYDILIVTKDGRVYTNVEKTTKTDSIEELKMYIKAKEQKWIYEGNQVITDVDKMQYDEIAYDERFKGIQGTNFDIYACLRNSDNGEIYMYNLMYKIISSTYEKAPIVIFISTILLILEIAYIVSSIGHKKGVEGVYTNKLDELPFGVLVIIIGIMLAIEFVCISLIISTISVSELNKTVTEMFIMLEILLILATYATLAIAAVTIIRRIKAKVFWKNTVIYKFMSRLKKEIDSILESNPKTKTTTRKLVMTFIGYTLAEILLFTLIINSNYIFFFWLIALWGVTLKILCNKLDNINKINAKIQEIYNGNKTLPLNEEEFKGELKQVAHELNDIEGGLSNAIEEAMKSERLKTELITNVSHDIKTPLTSIINYVDLLKKENIENEKVKDYLDVLDNKSQRLKKLTEDLVEASKASSGNIKLNIEKLNVKELITQVRGEFEDKFEKSGLEIIEKIPEEDVFINADSRYMFRIMENMYVNISKYAAQNSRVYVDVEKTKDTVKIILKNISKEKLNISVDELMQRFVRGDSARTTEGSGLGISIASSLTELQDGTFNIYLDGDLFKVVLEFKIA